MKIMGLDPSTSATGVARPNGTLLTLRPNTRDVARRLHLLAGGIRDLCDHDHPDLVMIEGYAPHSAGILSTIRLAELGGAIRLTLYELDTPYIEIPPSQLKRWATGQGRADKPLMVAAAEVLGYRPQNHDEADAALLQALALQAYGQLPPEGFAAYRVDVVAAITWPVIAA